MVTIVSTILIVILAAGIVFTVFALHSIFISDAIDELKTIEEESAPHDEPNKHPAPKTGPPPVKTSLGHRSFIPRGASRQAIVRRNVFRPNDDADTWDEGPPPFDDLTLETPPGTSRLEPLPNADGIEDDEDDKPTVIDYDLRNLLP